MKHTLQAYLFGALGSGKTESSSTRGWFMPDAGSLGTTLLGIDPLQSCLWMQVRKGEPEMRLDADDRLRHPNWPGAEGSVFIGDAADTLLRCFGPHEPPRFSSKPKFDQQQWVLIAKDSELRVEINSEAYWGWGLFSRCFVNRIRLTGPLQRRSRLLFDLVSGLGRNPWEPAWRWRWQRFTNASLSEHRMAWEELLDHARQSMQEQISGLRQRLDTIRGKFAAWTVEGWDNWDADTAEACLVEAGRHLETAVGALHDRNSAGLERAAARTEAALIEADPTTEVARTPFQEAEELLLPEEVREATAEEMQEQLVEHSTLPELSAVASEVVEISAEAEPAGEVEADWLLESDSEDDVRGAIPVVDLTEEQ